MPLTLATTTEAEATLLSQATVILGFGGSGVRKVSLSQRHFTALAKFESIIRSRLFGSVIFAPTHSVPARCCLAGSRNVSG